VTRGAFTDIGEFLRHGGGRFAPGQVDIDLLGGQVVAASDEPPKYSGG
jgi:hypothetical protein